MGQTFVEWNPYLIFLAFGVRTHTLTQSRCLLPVRPRGRPLLQVTVLTWRLIDTRVVRSLVEVGPCRKYSIGVTAVGVWTLVLNEEPTGVDVIRKNDPKPSCVLDK